MKLVAFQALHFQTLINWIIDEATMLNFAGVGFTYPLTKSQLEQYIAKYPNRLIYLAVNDDLEPMAYGEIIPQDADSARLGHLIIGKSGQRRKGLGQQLIRLLNEEAKTKLGIQKMELFLLRGNLQAEKCYLKYGFHFIENDFQISHKGKAYEILKMSIDI